MKQVTKQDRLRMLARIACEFAWAHGAAPRAPVGEVTPEFLQARSAHRLRLADMQSRLIRFIERNVANPELPGALTYDDIGSYDMQEYAIDHVSETFFYCINDACYKGAYSEGTDGAKVQTLVKEGERCEDALLIEFIEAHLTKECGEYHSEQKSLIDRSHESAADDAYDAWASETDKGD